MRVENPVLVKRGIRLVACGCGCGCTLYLFNYFHVFLVLFRAELNKSNLLRRIIFVRSAGQSLYNLILRHIEFKVFNPIHEQDPVQMIQFMLKDSGLKLTETFLDPFHSCLPVC